MKPPARSRSEAHHRSYHLHHPGGPILTRAHTEALALVTLLETLAEDPRLSWRDGWGLVLTVSRAVLPTLGVVLAR